MRRLTNSGGNPGPDNVPAGCLRVVPGQRRLDRRPLWPFGGIAIEWSIYRADHEGVEGVSPRWLPQDMTQVIAELVRRL